MLLNTSLQSLNTQSGIKNCLVLPNIHTNTVGLQDDNTKSHETMVYGNLVKQSMYCSTNRPLFLRAKLAGRLPWVEPEIKYLKILEIHISYARPVGNHSRLYSTECP